jgi:hypothetical protein
MTGTRSPLLTTCDVHDVAQLAGGLARVVDTAVVALLEQGRLEADALGRLHAVGSAPGRPVEQAVLDLAGPLPRRTIGSIRFRAQEDPRLTAVAERLVAAGLLRRNPLAGLSRSWPTHLRTAAGRRVLDEWRAAPRVGAAAVAVGGPGQLADRAWHGRVFGAVTPSPVRGPGTARWATGWGGDGGGGGWSGGWGGDGGGSCGGGDGGGGGGC